MLLRLIRNLLPGDRLPADGPTGADPRQPGENRAKVPRDWLDEAEALQAQGDLTGALECYRGCVAAHPANLEARLALTNALASAWRADECLEACADALKLASDPELFSGLLLYSHYGERPDRRALYEMHLRYGELMSAIAPPVQRDQHRNAPDPERVLRIGYVSRNFSQHAVGYFVEPVIARHDRERYRVYCYHTHPLVDAVTERIAQLADGWRHAHADDTDALAARVREDEIDVLVDLGGHTKLNRLPMFARKPAPVQMTWLGYPDTTGLSSIDYRITDATADPPPSADRFCSERLLRLDCLFLCYQPPADSPPVATRERGEAIVFGSFNHLLKVNGALIDLWARILEGVPGSRMLIKASTLANDEAVRRLLDRFRIAGIGADRLELRAWETERTRHLEAYNDIDIALDTFPYNGTTTTCEALWMGVPVVTLSGDMHVSRVGTTLLASVGLDELAAEVPQAYVQIAIELARDAARRVALRSSMRERLARSPLLDHGGFTRNLEGAYRQAWQTWCGARTLDSAP